jgi:hypothetical protein
VQVFGFKCDYNSSESRFAAFDAEYKLPGGKK